MIAQPFNKNPRRTLQKARWHISYASKPGKPRFHSLLFLLPVLVLLLACSLFSSQGTQQGSSYQNTNPNHITNPGGVYTGVFALSAPADMTTVLAFERAAKKNASIITWYQDWGSTDGTQNFQSQWMGKVRKHGSIPLVNWGSMDASGATSEPAYSLANIINGKFDGYITHWAKAAKAWGFPFFLRFDWEMNYNLYPWSELVNGNHAGQYVAMWKHVHAIFEAQGATNVTWVWSPNIDIQGETPLAELYPGAAYTDWVSMDGYNFGKAFSVSTWQTFPQIFSQTYNEFLNLAPNTPIMIAETAAVEQGGNKAQWITDTFTNQLPNNFPLVKAIIWFDQPGQPDYRIESSPASQQAFAAAMQSSYYAANDFASLTTSPIPALAPPASASPTASVAASPQTTTPTALPTQTPTGPAPTNNSHTTLVIGLQIFIAGGLVVLVILLIILIFQRLRARRRYVDDGYNDDDYFMDDGY